MPSFYLVDYVATTTEHSHITDLEVIMVDGEARLFASTRYDGDLTSWTLTQAGLSLADTCEFRGGFQAGGTTSIMTVEVNGRTSVLTGGGSGYGALQVHGISDEGLFTTRSTQADFTSPLTGIIHGETITLGNGTQAVYGGLAGGDGIGRLVFTGTRNAQSAAITADSDAVFAASVSAMAAVEIADAQYLLCASGTENGVTVWDVADNGALTSAHSLGVDDGLWVSAPTAMEVVTIGAQAYVILAAAGSSSLSVMEINAAGELQVVDHVIDSQHSRFASVSALAVVEHHGAIYVIAGGADDGISLFLLQADGTLLARGHLADTTQMGLENVSAITAVSVGDGIDIFVASSQVVGITQLHFATGVMGQTWQAPASGGTVSGTQGMDVLTGAGGNDRLAGGQGADILTDGAGADRLTGGQGADTFIFAYDDQTDVITDFEVGVDQIDLSAWPGLRSTAQLTFTSRSDGISISYGEDTLIVKSADGQPIDPAQFGPADLIGESRIPENIVPGFAGPAQDVPVLPERPEYIPHVYTPPPVDPNPEPVVLPPPPDQTDTNSPNPDITLTGNTTRGSSAAETLVATSARPIVYGMGGADKVYGTGAANTLYGGGGSDTIYGRSGDDRIMGDAGADRLFGNADDDTLRGAAGDDLLKGGRGADDLSGGRGADKVKGGSGNDTVNGNKGNDKVMGGRGNDTLIGDNGHDKIWGGSGNDSLSGGAKNDALYGGSGADRLWGGGGADLLNGNKGNDMMTGGAGADTFVFTDGRDTITDFSWRSDTLHLDDQSWRGNLSAQEVVDRYAVVDRGNIVFDFGGNDQLTLTGVTNLNALVDVISIV